MRSEEAEAQEQESTWLRRERVAQRGWGAGADSPEQKEMSLTMLALEV